MNQESFNARMDEIQARQRQNSEEFRKEFDRKMRRLRRQTMVWTVIGALANLSKTR